ncbi:MAG: hypothetical protein AAFO06_25825, partial [Cyanobacteria bacterium J06597_16]
SNLSEAPSKIIEQVHDAILDLPRDNEYRSLALSALVPHLSKNKRGAALEQAFETALAMQPM